ncbi:MAG: hypothetical protein QOI93_1967 [Rhodospirillaceae bacterium]|jgi:hypothetical protein|nr:hypothetical protein [Rhodospirillaceae bacterium]
MEGREEMSVMLKRTAGVPPAHDHDAGGMPAVRKI